MKGKDFINKRQRDVIDFITAKDMDRLLNDHQHRAYLKIISMLSICYHGGDPLNDDQREVLMHPYKAYGAAFVDRLNHMDFVEDKNRAENLADIDADLFWQCCDEDELELLGQIERSLRLHAMTFQLTEGQQAFLALCDKTK